MDLDQLLCDIATHAFIFPRESMLWAKDHREEVTPALLRTLEMSWADLDQMSEDRYSMADTYAMFLLAEFGETRAYPLIVNFFSTPDERIVDLMSDIITEDLGRILASVCGGDVGPIKRMAESVALDSFVRDAALSALLTLVAQDVLTREEAVSYFRGFFRGGLPREQGVFWDLLIGACCHIYPGELEDDIRQAFADDLLEGGHLDWGWVEVVLARGEEAVMNELRSSPHHQIINDAIAEMEWWACFDESTSSRTSDRTSYFDALDEFGRLKPPPPVRSQKVGRNDPCPCGSGKKYKYCCGKKRR